MGSYRRLALTFLLTVTVLAVCGRGATQSLAAGGEVGPSGFAVRNGTITGGNLASLQAADRNFLHVDPSSGTNPYRFILSARFDGVPNEATWLFVWQTGTADPGSARCDHFAFSERTRRYERTGGSLFDAEYRTAGGILYEPFNQWVSGESGAGRVLLKFKCRARAPYVLHLDRLTVEWTT